MLPVPASCTTRGPRRFDPPSATGCHALTEPSAPGGSFPALLQRFTGDDVLKDINWEVKKGERVGLVGWNGAGKTTQLKIITGARCAPRIQRPSNPCIHPARLARHAGPLVANHPL